MKKCLLIYLLILLSIQAYSQNCTLSVTLSQSAPTICSGYNVTLIAATSGGTAPFRYAWSTGETTPSISVDKAGTYTVTVSDKTPGCQPVKKSLTIAVTTTPDAPSAKGGTVCPNTSATLTATAPGGLYQWYDAAKGGNFLASGATYVTPPITAPTVFFVQTTVGGCTSPRTAVSVGLTDKPDGVGAAICSGNVATVTATGSGTLTWYNAPGGTALATGNIFTTPVLTATTTYYVTSTSNGCTSNATPVTVFVTPEPQTPTVANTSVCSGSSANLHAGGPPGGIFNWFSAPTGGMPLISSPDYTTPPLTVNTIYYVSASENGCESPRAQVVVTVTVPPNAPAAQTVTICYQSSTTLTASGSGAVTYKWFDAATAGNLLATGTTFTTPVLSNSTTYYVQADNGCTSSRAAINVNVQTQLPAPTAAGVVSCNGSATTLTASSQGGTYQWYDAATGGNLLANGPSYTTPPLKTTTTYYVQNTQAGCVSPRAAVTVTVLGIIRPPAASNTSVCSGSSASISASGSGGGYAWYDSATGGNLLATTQVYVTPNLAVNTTYYVEATLNNCNSTRTPVTVTVSATPSAPVINAPTICPKTSAKLTATGTIGTVSWYNSPSGGNLLARGDSYTTPPLSSNTTYYAQAVSGQCSSAMVAVTVTINPSYDPQFSYGSGTFCASGPNQTPVINNPNGGTFSAAPAGLVFVSTTTGEINIGASKPGSYLISFAGNGACAGIETARIWIGTNAVTTFTYKGPYCQDGTNPLPTSSGGGHAGTFTASPAGLVFVSPATGEIDLSKSNPGNYTVTNTVTGSGSCPGSVSTATVTIDQAVTVNAGPDQTVPAGSKVQLAGSVTGGVTTGTWSGGTGTFSNPSLPNAIYTPGAGETVAKLTLTSSNPPAPCGPVSSFVTITFASQTAAPTVQNVTDCAGSSTTLSATAPGGTYQWYDAPAGGSLLWTGPNFTTPALNANTTYYVQATLKGIASTRTAATVTVNAVPAAPTSPAAQTCTGTSTTLTASGPAGTYQWYDAPVGGNLLSNTSTYTTPVLSAGTSYYVQATVNGCISSRTEVDVTVTPVPNITSAGAGAICSGVAQNYTIMADLPTATFSWSRARVAGISNPAAANQTSSAITETLVNTTGAAVKVTYVITPLSGNCPGPAFNYVVTVNAAPVVTSPAALAVCNMTPDNYTITFNTPVTGFSWSRAAVPGISNLAVTGQTAVNIQEVLFNTTNSPINVTYVFNYQTATCTGPPFNLVITVYPQAAVTSAPRGIACTGFPQDYVITSNIPSATFNWSRGAVTNISNPAVSNQTSGTIDETLVNTSFNPVNVIYGITPITNGCPGTSFFYTAVVNPSLAVPAASSNSPVCIGSTVHLSTSPVNNATYLWTGPNGYTSALQNPDITNVTSAVAGTYTMTYTLRGCTSVPLQVVVTVDDPPVANAGPDQLVCIKDPAIFLAGTISGGTTTGIWTTAGTGTFSPSPNVLNAEYFPSSADKAAGSVKLTLTSTSKDNCNIDTSSMKVIFGPLPAVKVGPNQAVCSQNTSVQLTGAISIPGGGVWSTTGTGTFSSASQLNTTYLPSATDIKNDSVTLILTANNPGPCFIPADSMKIKFIPPPTVYAGGTRYVLKGSTITLYPTVSDPDVHYLWSPNVDINNDTLKNPVITGDIDRTYTLTITDSIACTAQDTAMIKVAPKIKINNTFTPNGDGVNDYWDITGLIAYQDATVDIFDRYGQQVFHSLGYPKPWDGTYNGKPVPVGVYYYIVNTHYNGQVLAGYVTVIR